MLENIVFLTLMIAFNNVSKSYNSKPILDGISFKINPGEFVSITGKSGAGKSTIIKLLIGEEGFEKGRIVVGKYEVNKLRQGELPQYRRELGVIFQDFKLLPQKTAHENIAYAMEVKGSSDEEIKDLVPQVLDMVGLADKAESFPSQLSGGEKQRVAIARAMINHPSILLADEPTGNLDPLNTMEIINVLLKINALNTTVILATHSKEVINFLERRVISLDHGSIIRDEERGRYVLS